VILKTVAFIFVAPFVGMFIAYLLTVLILWLFRRSNPQKAHTIFKRVQLLSSGLFSLGHGGSDSQKVVGIISAAMLVYVSYLQTQGVDIPAWVHVSETVNEAGKTQIHVPSWIPMSCYAAIDSHHDWRLANVKTMGSKIHQSYPS
jgi:PiT family inorganic phosphate transporter